MTSRCKPLHCGARRRGVRAASPTHYSTAASARASTSAPLPWREQAPPPLPPDRRRRCRRQPLHRARLRPAWRAWLLEGRSRGRHGPRFGFASSGHAARRALRRPRRSLPDALPLLCRTSAASARTWRLHSCCGGTGAPSCRGLKFKRPDRRRGRSLRSAAGFQEVEATTLQLCVGSAGCEGAWARVFDARKV